MRYFHTPEPNHPKRQFKLYWKDGGVETIDGRGKDQPSALENAFKRVGYSTESRQALTFWEEV